MYFELYQGISYDSIDIQALKNPQHSQYHIIASLLWSQPLPHFYTTLILKRFTQCSNQLTGTIPESFASFKSSVDLKLANNKLSGPIPKSLGNAKLSGLDVSGNRFTGDVSFLFGKDKLLGDLSLSKNQFKFEFTNIELPQGLRTLDISYNEIYGSIPKNIGQLPVLQSIDFSNNQLCGQIPSALKQFNASLFANNKCLCGAPLAPCK